MNIGLVTSIFTQQASLYRSHLSRPAGDSGASEADPPATSRVAQSSHPSISRLDEQARDAAASAAFAAEGRQAIQGVMDKAYRLKALADQYYSPETVLTDEQRDVVAAEFEETKAALLADIDGTELDGKALFDTSTRYTVQTVGTVSQTVTLKAGLERTTFADLSLDGETPAELQAVDAALSVAVRMQSGWEASAQRIDAAADAARTRLERAEDDLGSRVNRREARQLLDTTLAGMLAHAGNAMLMQASIPGSTAMTLLG